MSTADEAQSERPKTPDQDMESADVANGESPEQPERPEQPESKEHAVAERERTDTHPIGDERADRHRDEESPT